MSKPYPVEFRRDLVGVARKREAPLSQIAKDFRISHPCLHNWLKRADAEEGVTPGVMEKDTAALLEAKRRIRLLEQEAEVMRRTVAYLSYGCHPKMIHPLVLKLAAQDALLKVSWAVTCRVLGFSKQAFYQLKKNPLSQRERADTQLINAAYDIHHDDPAFGIA